MSVAMARVFDHCSLFSSVSISFLLAFLCCCRTCYSFKSTKHVNLTRSGTHWGSAGATWYGSPDGAGSDGILFFLFFVKSIMFVSNTKFYKLEILENHWFFDMICFHGDIDLSHFEYLFLIYIFKISYFFLTSFFAINTYP